MNYWDNKKILVTGGSGFLGSRVLDRLADAGPADVFAPSSGEYDLRNRAQCRAVVQGVDFVIHLAARVGGIGYNRKHPGQLFFDNIMMGTMLMEEARLAGVKKFIAPGTVCSYPKFAKVPFSEEDIWDGYPEETNAPYGLAKKMLIVQAQAYRRQYGFNAIVPVLVNLYGPGDNFNPLSSHVVPALIKRIVDAKRTGAKNVSIWGTGKATREFLYVGDAAEAIVLASERYNKPEPVNIGSGSEISIRDLAAFIAGVVGFTGEMIWDKGKPDGQPRRLLDVRRALVEFDFKAKTPLKDGITRTIEWYLEHGKVNE